jgi:hypothetical protein
VSSQTLRCILGGNKQKSLTASSTRFATQDSFSGKAGQVVEPAAKETWNMRLPRVRFTVRGMMVAVAVMSIASLLWAAWTNRRAAYCRSQAEWSAHEQWRFGQNRDVQLRDANRVADPAIAAILRYDAERYRQGISWHARREQDFRRAMWRPWEPSPNYPREPRWSPTRPTCSRRGWTPTISGSPRTATRERNSI